MARHQWAPRVLAGLLVLTVGLSLENLPAHGADTARSHGLDARSVAMHRAPASSWRTLPVGLAPMPRRAPAQHTAAQRTRSTLQAVSPLSGTWSTQAEITQTGSGGLGWSVAVNGTTALIGVQSNRTAYFYVRNGTTWSLQQEVTSTAVTFGQVVALSGNTAAVGAFGANSSSGLVYVYVRSGSTWYKQAVLSDPAGTADDLFGLALSLSGNTLLVGAEGTGGNAGAAYVFVRSGSTWTLQATLVSADGVAGDFFGGAVSLSGNSAMVGAPYKNHNIGGVYVFVRSSTGSTVTWSQQQEFVDPAGDGYFGIALSLNGNTALIGGQTTAWIYARSGTTWTEQTQLPTPLDSNDFGLAVSLSEATALVGARSSTYGEGTAYVFVNSGSTWTQQAELRPPDFTGGTAWFGAAVSISGNTAIIGAPLEHKQQGEAYIFARS